MRRVSRVVLVFVMALGCAACSPGGETRLTYDEMSAENRALLLRRAQESDVDQSQVDILAKEAITFSDYEAAMNNMFSCMREQGVEVLNVGKETVAGQDRIVFNVIDDTGDGHVTGIWDSCEQHYSYWVTYFWETSTPLILERKYRMRDALTEPLRECLIGYGIDFPLDASWDELTAAASQHLYSDPDEDCLSDIGVNDWEG
jgi:hypothetical protein